MIDGEGQSYNVQDTYTDYYGDTKTVVTNVTTKILVNNPSYYNSDLHEKIDRSIEIDSYSLKELPAEYAERVNTALLSENANLARNADYGGYLPKDCTLDSSCETVMWVKEIPYALFSETADEADTETCPYNSDWYTADANHFATFLSALLFKKYGNNLNVCKYDVINNKIYHADATDSHIRDGLYLAPGGKYLVRVNEQTHTKAQRVQRADKASWITTHNYLTGENVQATVEVAPTAYNTNEIRTMQLNYFEGNKQYIDVYIP
jgi:hypothetical protein